MTTYTNEEIQQNIETLTKKMDGYKLARTNLTLDINIIEKQIETWEELDKSQYKMF